MLSSCALANLVWPRSQYSILALRTFSIISANEREACVLGVLSGFRKRQVETVGFWAAPRSQLRNQPFSSLGKEFAKAVV